MEYIRKIKEEAWMDAQTPEDADSISDLATQEHKLSVWMVENKENPREKDDVALALAMSRNNVEELNMVIIDVEEYNEQYPNTSIELSTQKGATQYIAMVDKHINFVIPKLWHQYNLSQYIFEKVKKGEYDYYDPEKLLMLLDAAIKANKIKVEDLQHGWKRAYKDRQNEQKLK